MSSNAQSVIDKNAALIETFVTKYLIDNGIGVQLVEVVAKELFGQVVVNGTVSEDVAATPQALLSSAVSDVVSVSPFVGVKYDLQKVLDGAASLEFLVRYARKVNPAVFPPEVIPTDEVVNAALTLFHEGYKAVND